MQRTEAPRSEARRRSEGGEAEGQIQVEALDGQDDDYGAAMDVLPPAHGAGGDMGAEGIERLVILRYLLGFTAVRQTSYSKR